MDVATETHQFKTETTRLLELMIHSLYSNKEIYLRELISNAADALDRLRFEALTNPDLLEDDADLEIHLDPDPEHRTLTLSDNGIGMSRAELIDNVGTIARSGTQELLARLKAGGRTELPPGFIGQFGVGFYSSFMVADKITLVTRRAGESDSTRWESSGDGTYQVSDAHKEGRGTTIILELKPEDQDNGIDDFTSEFVLSRIVKKYSDFVPYPIKLRVVREKLPPEGDEMPDAERTTSVEDRTLNSMKALWERRPADVNEGEYASFYRHMCYDLNDPLEVIHQRAEGTLQYDALLFIPSKAPEELFYQAFESGLQLYVKNVKIIDRCEGLLPRYLRFVRGVVDCQDLPLNVSREVLQTTRQITGIKRALTKKVLDVIGVIKQTDPPRYLELWAQFGRALKEGMSDYDHRPKLTELVIFQSSHHPTELTTLTEYVERMSPDQSEIFYVTGASRRAVEALPLLETFKDKGCEVLYLVDRVDELLVQQLHEYAGKRLKSVGKGTIELGDAQERDEAKKALEEKQSKHTGLLELMQKTLDDHVKDVRLSSRLTTSAACLVGAEHDYSPQLEKLLLKGQGGGPRQRRILELNPNHPLFATMVRRHENNPEDPLLPQYAHVVFGQAMLAEGSEIPDPVTFGERVIDFMVRVPAESSAK